MKSVLNTLHIEPCMLYWSPAMILKSVIIFDLIFTMHYIAMYVNNYCEQYHITGIYYKSFDCANFGISNTLVKFTHFWFHTSSMYLLLWIQ